MPKKGSKTEKILTLTTTTPAIPIEIARTVDCNKSLVTYVLRRYGIQANSLDSFKSMRADIMAGYGEKILKSINLTDIKKARLGEKTLAFAQLYDKERLERGQSTANLASIHADIQTLRSGVKQANEAPKQCEAPVDNKG